MAAAFQRRGVHEERGFVVFTRNEEVARHFSQKQALLRLAVTDILPGTPWIWFGCHGQPQSSAEHEQEVLLPPGLLKVRTADGTFQQEGVLPVTYTPTDPKRLWPIPEPELETWEAGTMPAPRSVREMARRAPPSPVTRRLSRRQRHMSAQ